jgi:hypothetical protein
MQRSSNISGFKTPKPSKLTDVQTIEGSYGVLNPEIKELLIACSTLSTMQIPCVMFKYLINVLQFYMR